MPNTAPDESLHFDLLVIGSGQAGNPLASAFAAKGKRVALVERALVGGTCVNYGCTPTKTMLASAAVAAIARRSREYGVETGEVRVDLAAVVARKEGVVEEWRAGSEKKLADGVALFHGSAAFAGPRKVEVRLNDGATKELHAEIVVIDTGLSPSLPEVEGIQQVPHLDNVSVMQLGEVPKHLLVLGGGYVGLEFAQMFRRFGASVTIVQAGAQLLTGEDPDVAGEILSILREDGIEVLLEARTRAARQTDDGIVLTIGGGEASRTVTGSHLLVATGRKPNTGDLHLEKAGIMVDEHGYIPVNAMLETTAPGIYAVGDVKGGPAFTHISYDDYRILKDRLLDGGVRVATGRQVPSCVFTDPQLGRIGLSESEAKSSGIPFKVARLKMSSVARARETGHARGLLKAVVHAETGEILGFSALAAEGGEMMAMVQIAMLGKLPYTVLRDAVLAHPTYAEALNSLFMGLDTQ